MPTMRLLNTPLPNVTDTEITLNGKSIPAVEGELLIEALNRAAGEHGKKVPQVCYLPQMGPIQSCDTCMVSVIPAPGEASRLVRACATPVTAQMDVSTEGELVDIAQREAFDRILK